MFCFLRRKQERSPARLAAFLITTLVPLALWANFQHQRIGRYSLSTHLGITLMHHPINFIESAPDSYREIREVLLRARREHIREKGDSYGSVEAAIPELQKLTGLSYEQLDRKYFEMSVATILKRPGLYTASVAKAVVRYFKPAWYSRQFGIRGVLTGNWLPSKIVALGFVGVHLACMAVFLAYPLLWLLFPGLRLQNFWRLETVFIYSLVGVNAIMQALVVQGENARFRVAVEPLMIALAVWIIAVTLFPRLRTSGTPEAMAGR
jgi:hypothetical protein